MRKIAITVLFAAVLLQSCESYLDNKPKGITIPSQFNDYQKLLSSASLTRLGSLFPMFLTDDVHLLYNVPTAASYNYANKAEEERNAYSFKSGQLYTPGQSDRLWNDLYDQIFTYNTVINEISHVADASETEKLRLRAEALVGRAFNYLVLVNAYGRQYDATTAAKDYGVPLVLESDINKRVARSSVAEVYAKIESDLKEALPNLREKASFATYPSKSACYAFFARLYLYTGRYDEALKNAKLALAGNNRLYDHKPYQVTSQPMTWGRIKSIADPTKSFFYDLDNPECIYLRNFGTQISNTCCVSGELRDLFRKDLPAGAEDMRRTLFYADNRADYGGTPTVFPGETTFGPWINHNYGFTSSEMMLTAAECEARIGSAAEAMKYINTLRDSRIKNNQPLAAASNDEALRLVLEERRRDLAFVGYHRLFDLKRLNREARFAKEVKHNVEGTIVILQPNDDKYILPVSQEVKDFNPGMPQYERK